MKGSSSPMKAHMMMTPIARIATPRAEGVNPKGNSAEEMLTVPAIPGEDCTPAGRGFT